MDTTFKLSEIKDFLSISDDRFDLNHTINTWSDDKKLLVLNKVLSFINHFSMFKDSRPFMNSVYICVKKTLEIEADIDDYDELLIKNSIMRFVQEYISYSNLSQKEAILNFIADSFGVLKLQPLIINLGLLLKPMYKDEEYLKKLQSCEEIEVSYMCNDEDEIELKKQIDSWLEARTISLESQDNLKIELKQIYDNIIVQFNIPKESETYLTLLREVNEMLAMRLTVLSLMDMDDSLEPVPIQK
ncbi:MAG: hypothetical protein ACTSPS_01045 [Promethearchaeota archaeon]